MEAFGVSLLAAVAAVAPGVCLRFAPKPDKDVQPLREGLIDLDVGVLGEAAPEVRVQALYRDRFVGAVRAGHPLLAAGGITPARYAACAHVATSRRGWVNGPVEEALAALGLTRRVVAVVAGFPAALALARASDLVALVPERQAETSRAGMETFSLPVHTEAITISQMWHPRLEADPGHRWLRGLMLATCREGA